MPVRSSSSEALVLGVRNGLSDHRIVTLLEAETGVFQAMLFGGPKSALRSRVSPWHSGTLWLYSADKAGLPKIIDFDPRAFRIGLRENLLKACNANIACEVVIKSSGAGSPGPAWRLTTAFLDGLETAPLDDCTPALLRFLWRYLILLGVAPDIEDLPVSPGGASYLHAVGTQRPAESRKLCLSNEDVDSLKTALFMLVEQALGTRLVSLALAG
jgi:DNA repair protein RecO (recombination protein O)